MPRAASISLRGHDDVVLARLGIKLAPSTLSASWQSSRRVGHIGSLTVHSRVVSSTIALSTIADALFAIGELPNSRGDVLIVRQRPPFVRDPSPPNAVMG